MEREDQALGSSTNIEFEAATAMPATALELLGDQAVQKKLLNQRDPVKLPGLNPRDPAVQKKKKLPVMNSRN